MDYFQAIAFRVEEIDRLANAYLSKFDFLSNDQIMERVHTAAWKIFKEHNEDWNSVPEWVASTCDGWMPYASVSRNGSIYHALAFSMPSQDAHLRNLLEIAEGRETKELDFPVMAEKDVVWSMTDKEPDSNSRKRKTPIKTGS